MMLIKGKLRAKRIFSAALVFSLSLFILGMAVQAQAHDGSDSAIWDINDFTTQNTSHNDQDPFKGWFTLTTTNNTGSDWLDFHFELVDIGGGANTLFTTGGTPWSTAGNSTWTISADQRSLDFYFDAVPSAGGATFHVYTDNTADKSPFGILYYPTTTGGTGINAIAPEPVSTTLFLIGGATLGFRRLRKNSKAA